MTKIVTQNANLTFSLARVNPNLGVKIKNVC